jgi:hypothetical protein
MDVGTRDEAALLLPLASLDMTGTSLREREAMPA